MTNSVTSTLDTYSVYGDTVTVAPGQTESGTVNLPSGYVATGGGFTTYGPLPSETLPASDLVPLTSQPSPASAGEDEATGWTVYMKNTSATDTEYFQPWAIGVKLTGS